MRTVLPILQVWTGRCLIATALSSMLSAGSLAMGSPFAGIQGFSVQEDAKNTQTPVIQVQSDFPVRYQMQTVAPNQVKLTLYQAQLSQALLGPGNTLNLPPSQYIQQASVQTASDQLIILLTGANLGSHLPQLVGDVEPISTSQTTQTVALAKAKPEPNFKPASKHAKLPKPVVVFPVEALANNTAANILSPATVNLLSNAPRVNINDAPEPKSSDQPEPMADAQIGSPQIVAVTETKPAMSTAIEALMPTLPIEIENQSTPRAVPTFQTSHTRLSPIQAITIDEDGNPIKLVPKNVPIGLIDLNPLQNVYTALSQADPETAAERFMQRATTAYQQGHFAEAEQAMQEAIKLEPGNDDLLMALADVQIKQNRLPEAAVTYRKAMAQNPGQYEDTYAALLIRSGQRKQATEFLENTLQRNPQNAKVAYILGTLHEESGETQTAISYLQQAAELSPQSADILYNLGLAYEFIGDLPQAKAQYQKAQNLNPQASDIASALQRVQR